MHDPLCVFGCELPLPIGLMPVPHVATERRSDEPMRAIRVMVEAYLKRNHAFFAQIETLDNVMLLPIPEVQVVTVFVRSHIFQVEAFPKCIRSSPSTAHHHIGAWLIPVVIVERMLSALCSQRPAILNCSSSRRKPPGPLPSPSPSIEIIMVLSARQ